MPYLSEFQLRTYASTGGGNLAESMRRSRPVLAQLSIFLSHSHLDRELALGVINLLATRGISVYVDWNDTDMPEITDRTTAELVKIRIKENKLFMILATRNALASKWVPWETGVADQCKGFEKMVVIPVNDSTGNFVGTEYLQLYRRMTSDDGGQIGIFAPGTNQGILVEEHLRKFI